MLPLVILLLLVEGGHQHLQQWSVAFRILSGNAIAPKGADARSRDTGERNANSVAFNAQANYTDRRPPLIGEVNCDFCG
jgi:hypothetical protein